MLSSSPPGVVGISSHLSLGGRRGGGAAGRPSIHVRGLIAAQARAEDARLMTADDSILGNLDLALRG